MNDRWLRAEERLRQSTEERRYRRSDQDWGEADTPATGNSEIPAAREDLRAPRGGELPAARSGEMRAARSRGMRRVAPGEEPRSRRGNEPRAARGARHAAPSDDDWDDFDDTSVIPRYSDEYEAGYPEHSTGAHARVEPDYGRHGYPEPAYGDPYADQGYVDQGPAGIPLRDRTPRATAVTTTARGTTPRRITPTRSCPPPNLRCGAVDAADRTRISTTRRRRSARRPPPSEPRANRPPVSRRRPPARSRRPVGDDRTNGPRAAGRAGADRGSPRARRPSASGGAVISCTSAPSSWCCSRWPRYTRATS